jgi:DNA (cytosine-5)-methyltransferase 1
MEQIRIIKEMREKYGKPRHMVWENVPGAFSSSKGEDFGAVLHETVKVVEPKAPPIPKPKNGWPTAGSLVGDKWSVAWRVLDAKFWGVPQRRRRIALVADFGGQSAPEILFERESVYGYPPQSGAAWETSAATAENSTGVPITSRVTYCIQGNCIDRADTAGCNGKGWTEDVSYTLNTVDRPAVCGVPLLNDQGGSSLCGDDNADVAPTLRAEMHGNIPAVCAGFKANQGEKAHGIAYEKEICPCLSAATHDASVFVLENHPADSRVKLCEDGVFQTLSSRMGSGGGNVPMVFAIDRAAFNQGQNAKYNIGIDESGTAYTVVAKGPGAVAKIGINGDTAGTLDSSYYKGTGARSGKEREVIFDVSKAVVRRLTPLECERLQGFPDGWTDIGDWTDSKGKVHKTTDSARYKALGNSISLPNWFYVLQKLSVSCGADVTMASLFDGIGGFSLLWETLNGKGTCLWASEIEEFPIAVTKMRFKEE